VSDLEHRAAPLLTGHRGAPAMDTDALEQLILRVAELAKDFPEVSELDLQSSQSVLGLRLSTSRSS
jgi:ATP-grasp domain